MAADAKPAFDVVTIKPSVPNRPGKGFGFRGRHFVTVNTNLNDLVALAYGVHAKQIVGAPEWFGADLYDIDGVPDVEGQPNLQQMGTMVQKLLADRFKLTFHHDKKELSVYVIGVAGGGPKLTKSALAPNDPKGFGFRNLGDFDGEKHDHDGIRQLDAVQRHGQASGGSNRADRQIRFPVEMDPGRLAVHPVQRDWRHRAATHR